MKKLTAFMIIFMLCMKCLVGQAQTLEQCQRLAIEHNIKMIDAKTDIDMAKEQQEEAFTKYFPSVSGTGWAFRSNHGLVKGEVATGDILPSELARMIPTDMAALIPQTMSFSTLDKGLGAGIMAIQPVFAGGRIVNGNKLARLGVEVSRIQSRMSENEVRLTTQQYYNNVIVVQEKLKTIASVENMLVKLESDVSMAVKAGVKNRNDLLQVQLKQNEMESTRSDVENKLKLSKLLLAQYIGVDSVDCSSQSIVHLPEFPIELKREHSAALSNTPEYQLLDKNVESKTLQRKMQTGSTLPSIGIGAGYNTMRVQNTNNNFGAVFATVSIPISDWWAGTHATKRKKLDEVKAQEDMKNQSELLVIRMQNSWNDVENAYRQLAIAKKSIEQSEENLRLNNDYYRAGTTIMSNLLDAQMLYQQSHDKYVDSYAQYLNKILEYKQVTGQ